MSPDQLLTTLYGVELLTRHQIAARYALSPTWLARYLPGAGLRAFSILNRLHYYAADVAEWMESNPVKPTGRPRIQPLK